MTTQECKCDLPPEMSWAGAAAQLCQHSSSEQAQEVQSQLLKLIDNFMQEIPVDDLVNTPLMELSQKYMKDMAGNDYNLLNQDEHSVLMIMFLRHVGIAVNTLMATMIGNRNERLANAQPKKRPKDILRDPQDQPIQDEPPEAEPYQQEENSQEDQPPQENDSSHEAETPQEGDTPQQPSMRETLLKEIQELKKEATEPSDNPSQEKPGEPEPPVQEPTSEYPKNQDPEKEPTVSGPEPPREEDANPR